MLVKVRNLYTKGTVKNMEHYKAYLAAKDPLNSKKKSTEPTKSEGLTNEIQKRIKLIEKAFR